MKYKAVIFDMDGTILNTLEDLKNATNYALKQYNMPEHTIEEVRMFVGNGIPKLIERAVPAGTDPSTYSQVLKTFMEYYSVHNNDSTCAYPGIQNLVTELKKLGVKTAVSTNKADGPAQDLGQKYFDDVFDLIVGAQEGINVKPSPDSVNLILKKFGIEKKDACYIGDSDVDLMTAKNSKLDFIGVDWGFRGRAFLEEHGAKVIVSTAEEILKLVKN